MLENLRRREPSLVNEASEKLKVGQIQRVLQSLLRDHVPIRDLETILEALTEEAAPIDGIDQLTEYVRRRLGRALSQQYCGDDGKLWCVRLAAALEERIGSCAAGDSGPMDDADGEFARTVGQAVSESLSLLRRQGRRPVVLCAPQVRATLRRLIASDQPDAVVLATNEIDKAIVRSVGQAGIPS